MLTHLYADLGVSQDVHVSVRTKEFCRNFRVVSLLENESSTSGENRTFKSLMTWSRKGMYTPKVDNILQRSL